MKLNYQNYKHYKLPITIKPLDYGKLIYNMDNIYIMQVTIRTIALITQFEDFNEVKFFKEGDLVFIYKDHKIDENTFIRSLENKKFTFNNNKLVDTQILIIRGKNNLYYTDANSILIKNKNKFYYKDTNSILINKLGIRHFNKNLGNILKLKKTKSLHAWKFIEIKIENKLFTKELFNLKFSKFWNQIIHEFTDSNHMFILFKVKYIGTDYTTIGKLQRLNKNDKDWYFNWIINNMIYKSEYYNETPITSFIFSYGFINEKINEKEIIQSNINFQSYKNNKLPISFNPLDYGKLISEMKWENYIQFILQSKENLLFNINKFENHNEISLISGGNIILNFKDEFLSENKFVRILDNKKYYFENNKEILYIKLLKTKFISKISLTKILTNDFITLDIETFIKNNILTVCCISIYDGKSKSSYFLSDFKNSEELILTALKSILIRKYNGYNIYIHNFAKFDAIFLLKYLIKLGIVEPIIHNDRLISINLNYGKNNEYKIQFKDSYLILLASLVKLAKAFGVETQKSIFPYLFINENNLNYIGQVPDFKFFGNKINLVNYKSIKIILIIIDH
jgi:DNA polymerase type B, organellar and viral